MKSIIHSVVFLITARIVSSEYHTISRKLPDDLLFGAASSSYQVEGAWNEDGKGESIWDRFAHTPNKIKDGSNGDIACDAYHKTKEDVALMKEVGLQFYRFSLSWSRILPTGFSNKINQAGIDYYNNLIDELISNNIEPIATIFHWDLPQPIQDLGGWIHPQVINWFESYSRIVFDKFGDRIKTWITINEPKQVCQFGYGTGLFAPGIQSGGIGEYICSYNVLKAHALVYHLYDKYYRHKQKGRLSMTLECAWSEPETNDPKDIEAAERRRQFDFGIYAHPVYHVDGDYPSVVKEFVASRSKKEGFSQSRLPKFSSEEIKSIRGTYDFFGLNHYTTVFVKDAKEAPLGNVSSDVDVRVTVSQDNKWLTGSIDYFRLVPWGFRKVLNYIKDTYNNPEIMITENGFPDFQEFDDNIRIKYYTENINAALDAIEHDRVKITTFTAWSFTDNFEWSFGYGERFGLYYVNYTDPNRTRMPKLSAKFYKNLIRQRTLTGMIESHTKN